VLAAADPSLLGSWIALEVPDAVSSVNSQQGAVILGKADVGLGSVDNTADAAKPVSAAQQAALDAKQSTGAAISGAPSLAVGRATSVSYKSVVQVNQGENVTGLRVDQNDTVNSPRAAQIVQNAPNWGLKVDQLADFEAVNITQGVSTTDLKTKTVLNVLGRNTAQSTLKVVNDVAQTDGAVIAAVGQHIDRDSSVISADNWGGGWTMMVRRNTVTSKPEAGGLRITEEGAPDYTGVALDIDARHTSGNVVKVKNSNAQTSGEMALFWMSDIGSTAPALKIAHESTQAGGVDAFQIVRGGVIRCALNTDGGFRTASGMWNASSFNNSRVRQETTGSTIDRSVADANPVLIVQNRNATSTGDIITARDDTGAARLRVSKTGVGVNGSAPVAKGTITGSRGGNAALASLLAYLASRGDIVDSTTA
jgi:hypothetical protein